jgi:hypothetical protein
MARLQHFALEHFALGEPDRFCGTFAPMRVEELHEL